MTHLTHVNHWNYVNYLTHVTHMNLTTHVNHWNHITLTGSLIITPIFYHMTFVCIIRMFILIFCVVAFDKDTNGYISANEIKKVSCHDPSIMPNRKIFNFRSLIILECTSQMRK